MLTTILSFLAVLGVLIFIHELGHYLAARHVGVRVEAFSIGFPPTALAKQVGETEYRISWLPVGWKCLKVAGPLDFELTGILAGITEVLAKEKFSVFAISTFDTDYILIKKQGLTAAISALQRVGYIFN